jgi:hypothetical protein
MKIPNEIKTKTFNLVDLEISTECFAEIVLSGVVDKGVIEGACIWKTPKILARV